MARKKNHDMAQNYETNISLICRKSTDNWIDSLISFTVLMYTMYYFNMNLPKRKVKSYRSDKSCFKFYNVDYLINRVIFNFSCKFFSQKTSLKSPEKYSLYDTLKLGEN